MSQATNRPQTWTSQKAHYGVINDLVYMFGVLCDMNLVTLVTYIKVVKHKILSRIGRHVKDRKTKIIARHLRFYRMAKW